MVDKEGLMITRKEKRKIKEDIITREAITLWKRGRLSGRSGCDGERRTDGID